MSSSRRWVGGLLVLGWLALLGVGIAAVWFGFLRPADTLRPAPVTSATLPIATPTVLIAPPTPTPTPTPLPSPTPTFTVAPTPTPLVAKVRAPEEVNVRSGPGTQYDLLGRLPAGGEAIVIGRHGGWWQISFNGSPAWVYGEIVTAVNTEGVPEVVPPPPPTPAPQAAVPTATPLPPTATPAPSAGPAPLSETRGLRVNAYVVEGAPGPFSAGAPIWFSMDITNVSGQEIPYLALGTWVEETGQFQKSYFAVPPAYPSFMPNQHFTHRDRIMIPVPGNYRLWLAIQFVDGTGVRLYGPVPVIVQ